MPLAFTHQQNYMKYALAILAFVLVGMSANAQYRWDFGTKIGAANYLGDIGGRELTRRDFVWDMHLPQTRFAAGVFARYKRSKRMAFSFNADFIQIGDADRYTSNPARRARNMNFRTNMAELGGRAELTIWYDNDVGNRGYYNPDFKMYLFAGLAGFYYKPTGQIFDSLGVTKYGGTWFDLRSLRTEGQSSPYGVVSVAIPAGIGMHFTFNKSWRLGWELSWRTTFTDYIDDVSTNYGLPDTKLGQEFAGQTYQGLLNQINKDNPTANLHINNFQYIDGAKKQSKRGDPTHNDSYLTSQIVISKVIRGRSQFYRSKYSWLKNRAGVRRSRAKF
jgi:hypothetical protein